MVSVEHIGEDAENGENGTAAIDRCLHQIQKRLTAARKLNRDAAAALAYDGLPNAFGRTAMARGQDTEPEGQAKVIALKGLEPFMADAAQAYKAFVAELALGRYDVFLSHAAADATEVDALAAEMRALGLKVYVDRLDDTLPDRSAVNRETADRLRERMRACPC